ncbi:WD40 repeat domain-containing protein [bacterium]|nr:MAG: WD40 repeat domain-containing protein [bacterium]
MLSTGRDQKIIHWNVTERRKIAERTTTGWPRCAAVAGNGRLVALVSDRVQLLQLPDLDHLDNLPAIYSKDHRTRPGISRCATFAPAGTDLLTGQMNGLVTHYSEIDSTRRRQKRNLDKHIGPLVGLEFLPRHALALTLGAEGEMHFIEWPGGSRRSQVKAPLVNLSSLKVSGDGNFIATGSGQDAFTLWDLRTLDLPAIFALPLPDYRPEHLAAINSLVEVKDISAPIRNALQYLQALLQYRYRFDIQIAEITHIQPGEFDILVDDPGENSGYNG